MIGDAKLIRDIVKILKPGGRLFITTPNYYYRPLNEKDKGPFEPIEDGRHVKRGYSSAELYDLLRGGMDFGREDRILQRFFQPMAHRSFTGTLPSSRAARLGGSIAAANSAARI